MRFAVFRQSERGWSWPATAGAGLLLLGVVGCLDWVTGPNVDFSLFYLVPVCVVGWHGGQMPGIAASVLCAIVWLCVDRVTGAKPFGTLLAYWNLTMRVAFFTVSVLLIEGWKSAGLRLTRMVEQRTAALRRLAGQLSVAEDAERRKLAYDMHDSLGQTLSLIKMNLDAVQSQLADRPAAHRGVGDCAALVDSVIKQTRTLMFDLYPAMLDDLGLLPTLEFYARDLEHRAGVEIVVSEQGVRRTLTTTVRNYLFRAAKELVGNAIRHGQAREIIVSVCWDQSKIRLVVDDDGRGFDLQGARMPESSRGFGLAGVNERITSMGGRMDVESRPGEGSRVIVEVPLWAPEDLTEHGYAIANSAG